MERTNCFGYSGGAGRRKKVGPPAGGPLVLGKGRTMTKIKSLLKRWFVDGMSAMALGLFSSLIVGLILSQLAAIPGLSFLGMFSEVLSSQSPVIGAAIGVAVACGLKHKPLVIFSCAAVGALGYALGGPVGAYLAALVGCEIGGLVAGRTGVDIVLTPLVTLLTGGIVAKLLGAPVSALMGGLGAVINSATELSPLPMGIIVSVIVGLALTAPISSAALCIMLGLSGLAAGAAAVGCSAQMVGFAVTSFRKNGVGGLISQGLGTSMLQFANIVRHPQILIAPTLAGAILGPVSTCLLRMTNTPSGAGMGTSGLVGQFGAWAAMSGEFGAAYTLVTIVVMHLVAPALLSLAIHFALRRVGIVKDEYLKLNLVK